MKNKFFPILLALPALILAGHVSLQAQESDKKKPVYDLDYSVALNAAYNRTIVELKGDRVESALEFSYLAFQIDVEVLDFLTVGVVAGYNSNRFKDPVNLFSPPVPLIAEGERFSAMMGGLRGRASLFSWKEFSFEAHAQLLYFRRFTKELNIDLPLAAGTGILKNGFHQIGLDLLIQYDGLSSMTLFAGPQLNIVRGTLTGTKTIGGISTSQSLTYNQKNLWGLVAGIYYELGSNFDISAKISLIANTSLSVMMIYVF